MQCCRNKATAVAKEMSALTIEGLGERMRKQPFSLATDGSNDQNDAKLFPLVVTIQSTDGLVNAELLSVPVCSESATGKNIFDLIDQEFRAQRIPWRNCIAFGCDNAAVMTGTHKGVYHFVKEETPNVHLARCCLHLVHLAAKKGAACLPPVDDVLVDIFYYFQKSSNRQQQLKSLQEMYDVQQKKMLKHVCTRWLSIGRCLERLITNWEALLHFFKEAKENIEKKKSTQSTYATKKVLCIYDFLRSPTNKLYCKFLSYTVKVFDPVLIQLQGDQPLIHLLRNNLCGMLTDIYSRFVLPRAFAGHSVEKVQYSAIQNQKQDADLLIGSEARKMLQNAGEHNLRQQRIEEFYNSVRAYFQAVVKYLLDKLPLADPVLTAAAIVDPKNQIDASSSQLDGLLERFPVLIPNDSTKDMILEQFATYQVTDLSELTVKAKEECMRADKVWCLLASSHPQFSELSSVMRGILTIPHSSASCERIFSMVRKINTDQRSSLHRDTTEALLVLKTKPQPFEFSDKNLKDIKSAYYRSLQKK